MLELLAYLTASEPSPFHPLSGIREEFTFHVAFNLALTVAIFPESRWKGEGSDAVRYARSSCTLKSSEDFGRLHRHELHRGCRRHHGESGCRRMSHTM